MKKILIITTILIAYISGLKVYANSFDNVMYNIQNSVNAIDSLKRLSNERKERNQENYGPDTSSNVIQTPYKTTMDKSSSYNNEDEILYPIYYPEVDRFGYENAKGVSIIPAKFDDARPFSEGLAAVYNGYRWGFIDRDGVYVIKPQFGGYSVWEMIIVNPFVNGTCAVFLGNNNAQGFSDDLTDEYALINRKGEIIKRFDSIYPTWYGSEGGNVGEYHACINQEHYIVDSQGNIIKKEF